MWAITSKYHTETKLYTTIGLFLSFLHRLYLITKFCHFFIFFLVLLLLSIILLPLNLFRAFSLKSNIVAISSVQLLSCCGLCNPMNCSTPGLPAHHQLLEFTQRHVHWVSDAIQPSHPLSSPSSLAFNLSQHQCLFQWVSSSHQVAKVLELQLQHQQQSFQWIFRTELF